MVSYEQDNQFTIRIPDELVAQGFSPPDLEKIMLRHFEPADATVAEDSTAPDYTQFSQVEPLLLDVAALLRMVSVVDAAADSYEGVILSPRQTRVLHRGLKSPNSNLNRLESLLQDIHVELTGKYYDHEKYDDGGVWSDADEQPGTK